MLKYWLLRIQIQPCRYILQSIHNNIEIWCRVQKKTRKKTDEKKKIKVSKWCDDEIRNGRWEYEKEEMWIDWHCRYGKWGVCGDEIEDLWHEKIWQEKADDEHIKRVMFMFTWRCNEMEMSGGRTNQWVQSMCGTSTRSWVTTPQWPNEHARTNEGNVG